MVAKLKSPRTRTTCRWTWREWIHSVDLFDKEAEVARPQSSIISAFLLEYTNSCHSKTSFPIMTFSKLLPPLWVKLKDQFDLCGESIFMSCHSEFVSIPGPSLFLFFSYVSWYRTTKQTNLRQSRTDYLKFRLIYIKREMKLLISGLSNASSLLSI